MLFVFYYFVLSLRVTSGPILACFFLLFRRSPCLPRRNTNPPPAFGPPNMFLSPRLPLKLSPSRCFFLFFLFPRSPSHFLGWLRSVLFFYSSRAGVRPPPPKFPFPGSGFFRARLLLALRRVGLFCTAHRSPERLGGTPLVFGSVCRLFFFSFELKVFFFSPLQLCYVLRFRRSFSAGPVPGTTFFVVSQLCFVLPFFFLFSLIERRGFLFSLSRL